LKSEIIPASKRIMKAYRRLADHTQWPPSRLIMRLRIKDELKKRPDRRPMEINTSIVFSWDIG
jgi:hypothetical protein